jgi:hypothetical protein
LNYAKIINLSLLFLIASCRPTALLQEGKTKFYTSHKLSNLVVVAMPGQLMDVRAFENAVVSRLKVKGLSVTQGYKIFENEADIPADVPAIKKVLKAKGYDGMIEIKLVSIRNEESSTGSDYVTNREYRIMDVANYGKLVQEYSKREEKGATFVDTKVKMDFRLMDLSIEDGQVIWSARTETTNPKTAKDVAVGMSNKALRPLKKLQVLGR